MSARNKEFCTAWKGKKPRWRYFLMIGKKGEMAEWSNAAVSKTVVRQSVDRGFESPSLRKAKILPFREEGVFIFRMTGPCSHEHGQDENKNLARETSKGVFWLLASPPGIMSEANNPVE